MQGLGLKVRSRVQGLGSIVWGLKVQSLECEGGGAQADIESHVITLLLPVPFAHSLPLAPSVPPPSPSPALKCMVPIPHRFQTAGNTASTFGGGRMRARACMCPWSEPCRCRKNISKIRQSRPYSGLKYQVTVLKAYEVILSLLGIGPSVSVSSAGWSCAEPRAPF